jgi:hypothetical protein
MEGGTIPLENREWNLQCVDSGPLPHPQLPSYGGRHRGPADDEVVRLLPGAGLLELRHRALQRCTPQIPAVVPAGRHRGLGTLPGWRLDSTRPAVRLARFLGRITGPPIAGPGGEDRPSITQPARILLSSKGGVPLKLDHRDSDASRLNPSVPTTPTGFALLKCAGIEHLLMRSCWLGPGIRVFSVQYGVRYGGR